INTAMITRNWPSIADIIMLNEFFCHQFIARQLNQAKWFCGTSPPLTVWQRLYTCESRPLGGQQSNQCQQLRPLIEVERREALHPTSRHRLLCGCWRRPPPLTCPLLADSRQSHRSLVGKNDSDGSSAESQTFGPRCR